MIVPNVTPRAPGIAAIETPPYGTGLGVKGLALAALTHHSLLPLYRPLTRGRAAIFTLHRFANPDLGIPGHPVELLREQLAELRRERCFVMSLGDLLEDLRDGREAHNPCVVFTVDDGYADFAQIGAPIFAEFDCPVAMFLTTDFLDGKQWHWWDRIEAALLATDHSSVTLEIDGRPSTFRWDSVAARMDTSVEIAERLKLVINAERLAVIDRLIDALGVELPARPPAAYAPMTWAEVEECGRHGATFGPHTVTHPILTQVDDRQSEYELVESWRRVSEMTKAAVPVFSYPSGKCTEREFETLARAGLLAAVTNRPRYASAAAFDSDDPYARYAVPRFPYPDDRPHVMQVVSGLERAKEKLRQALAR
jgi:peptidoglycan/xylan/chitin deacetylase (PgdA/CDA1 family)